MTGVVASAGGDQHALGCPRGRCCTWTPVVYAEDCGGLQAQLVPPGHAQCMHWVHVAVAAHDPSGWVLMAGAGCNSQLCRTAISMYYTLPCAR